MMWYGDMGGWSWGMMIFGSLFWLLVLGAIAIVWGAVGPVSERTDRSTGTTPLDTLKSRYARGEINRDEFERAHRDLA